ncbi:MAG: M4 family metallopeptidase, partial [Bacteroidota bacterium]
MRSLHLRALLVACLLPLLVQAQLLTGEKAKSQFPGAITVRLDDGNPVPQFVRFSVHQHFDTEAVFHWLRKTTQLDERTTFEYLNTERDQLGMKHHRYQQLFEGIPVHAGTLILHEQNGRVRSINGELFALDARSISTGINAQDIVEKALHHYPAQQYAWEVGTAHRAGPLATPPEGKLVWVSEGLSFETEDFQLAYELDIYAIRPHLHRRIWLDVNTGMEIAGEHRSCHTDTPGTAQTMFSGVRPITAFQNTSGVFESRETGRGNGISTYNTNYTGDYASAYLWTDDDNDWEVNDGSDEGMECHWATEAFYDLLLDEFGRNSLDDAGFELISYTRYTPEFANAFWNGQFATFGSGATGSVLDRSLASVEVTSHEFTHGLTEFTAGLIYASESGALNESFSDIFGLYLDFKLRPEAGNWTMGEESTSSGEGIRSAENPNFHGNPDCYGGEFWFDGGGVHTNSGVSNHWYYLLSEGGEGTNDLGDDYDVEGVGIDVAAQVAYRNLVVYLTPSSNYADAAFYSQLAATDLYGRCSSIFASVANAWFAVGVGVPVSEELEADFTAQQVHCEVPAEIQFLNRSSFSESAVWDFGDGNTSTDYSPIHTYTGAGVYDVQLISTGCEMGSDTILREQYIVVDPEADACDTIVMVQTGQITVEACSGIILDPGGDGPYQNNVNSTITVEAPGDSPFTINLISAAIESGWDYLYIYDGLNASAPLLDVLSGNFSDQTYVTTGGSFTLVFTTDGSVVRDGFLIQFESEGGSAPPTAGFDVSTPVALVSEPIQLSSTAVNASSSWYDMGDGTILYEESPTHRYTSEGTFTIMQVVSSCSTLDTAYQDVTIAGSSTLTLEPDSICVTLVSGESLDTTLSLTNTGDGSLFYEWEAPTADWATLSGTIGVLAAGDNTTTGVNIQTGDLLEGIYDQVLTLYAGDENDPVRQVYVKLTVIGVPQIITTPNPTDFGNVFSTLSYEQSFTIENNGTGTLVVESWSNGLSDYSIDLPPSFELPALASATVTVMLDPSTTGSLDDILNFQTNAGSYDHQLLANSVPAPIAGVDPTMICVTLEAGQSTIEGVTISNTGGSELNYEWGATGSILVWMYGVDQIGEGQAVLNILDTYLPDVEVVVYEGDNTTELAALLAEARVLIMPESEFGSATVFSAAAPAIQDFVSSGGGLIHAMGGIGEPVLNTGVFEGVESLGSSSESLIVIEPDHPLMVDVTGPLTALNFTQGYNFSSPERTDVLGMFNEENSVLSAQEYGAGRAVFIGFDYFAVTPYAEQIMANAVNWVSTAGVGGLPSWLNIDPISGTVEAGSSETGNFEFDATGLSTGTYEANVFLISNDPANPEILVNVKLIVVALPEVDFIGDPLFSCDGLVNFTDLSQNEPASWEWDFGDGNTSTEQNPSHLYTSNGLYTVSLTACNDLGCEVEEKIAYVQIDLEGSFCDTLVMQDDQIETLTGCTGYILDDGGIDGNYTNNFFSTVHLLPEGADGITLHVEDFLLEGCCDYVYVYDGPTTGSPLIGQYNGTDLVAGDMISSTGDAMTIVFDTDGSVTYSGFVFRYECSGVAPVAGFSHDTDMDCLNTVNFTNASLHGESYLWDFGDGTTSEEEHPTHHFSTAGHQIGRTCRTESHQVIGVFLCWHIDIQIEGYTADVYYFFVYAGTEIIAYRQAYRLVASCTEMMCGVLFLRGCTSPKSHRYDSPCRLALVKFTVF